MSRGTQEIYEESSFFQIRGYHPLWLVFPNFILLKKRFLTLLNTWRYSYRLLQRTRSKDSNPLRSSNLGWSHFAHRYSGNLIRFIFLGVLRCFSSPTYRKLNLHLYRCVSTFGNPRLSLLDS